MRQFLSCLMLAVLVAVPFTALAEDEAPVPAEGAKPVAKRIVDPAAMKLLDAAREKVFSNRAAGLKNLSCSVTMKRPAGDIVFAVSYEVPDKSEVKLKSLPAELEALRERVAPDLVQVMERRVVEWFNDEPLLPAHLEKYNVAIKEGSENTIVVTAFAEDANARKREIIFGEDGLPKRILETGARGEVEMNFTYKKVDDRFLVDTYAVQTPNGSFSVKSEHEKSGKFWLLTKVVTKLERSGHESAFTLSDYKVNSKAATLAETPATSEKPGDDD